MKRKRIRTKTKAKDSGQFKNIAIAVLALVVLFVIVAVKQGYFEINPSEAAPSSTRLASQPPQRNWPLMAIQPTKTVKPTAIPGSDPGPDTPYPSNIQTPYAFVRSASATNPWGPVYYSSGPTRPTILFSGNCMNPTPSGNYVFCIRVDVISPTRTTPIKIDVNSGVVTELASPRSDPSPWNYITAADEGNTYIYTALGRSGPEVLQGPLYIVKDGVQVYYTFGSYLFPNLSSDGTMASWCYDSSPLTTGDRDFYVFTIATQTAVKVYNVGNNSECESGDLTRSSDMAAWLVKINGVDGWRDSKVYRAVRGSTGVWGAGIQVNASTYRWNDMPRWSNEISPENSVNVTLAWAGNQDAYLYAGYNIWGISRIAPAVRIELTTWDPNRQDIWPDVDINKMVIYGRGVGYWSHYIPTVASFREPGQYTYIIDPGAISRDFSFAN